MATRPMDDQEVIFVTQMELVQNGGGNEEFIVEIPWQTAMVIWNKYLDLLKELDTAVHPPEGYKTATQFQQEGVKRVWAEGEADASLGIPVGSIVRLAEGATA